MLSSICLPTLQLQNPCMTATSAVSNSAWAQQVIHVYVLNIWVFCSWVVCQLFWYLAHTCNHMRLAVNPYYISGSTPCSVLTILVQASWHCKPEFHKRLSPHDTPAASLPAYCAHTIHTTGLAHLWPQPCSLAASQSHAVEYPTHHHRAQRTELLPHIKLTSGHHHAEDILTQDDLSNVLAIVNLLFKTLWPSDAMWRRGHGLILAQIMACCLTAPSHYLNQIWLIIGKVQWHSSEGDFVYIRHQSLKLDWKLLI